MLFVFPDFMLPSQDSKSGPQLSESFSEVEAAQPDDLVRISRFPVVQNEAMSTTVMDRTAGLAYDGEEQDVFEQSSEVVDENQSKPVTSGKLPIEFDELPIELVGLADSFIDSLSAKVYPNPPTVDKLSSLFQDFYAVAAHHINTHISALSSKQYRSNSPAPSIASISSTASILRAKAASISSKEKVKQMPAKKDAGEQMMTAEEIVDRKRARKALEQKRLALEEAIERRICEGIYDRIWRHRSTQDEAQDEKLRSKTAALSVVGIGPSDLGVDLGHIPGDTDSLTQRANDVRDWLQGARDGLRQMNDEKFPLGKLLYLKAAHKSIVDTLAHFHPSSSADEIMPMLIYTLITCPTEGLNVISNLYFIQRFRNEIKIDGEAAYCLTNLEAAITFLETVDLATLREDEAPSGPLKSNSRPSTPVERPYPMPTGSTMSSLSAPTLSSASISSRAFKPPPSPSGAKISPQPTHNRRLSDLFQPPAQALGAAGDAMLTTADQGFKSISNSLGDSYNFLIGKLKERQNDPSSPRSSDIVVPKTLEDARKLVGTPPPDDDGSASDGSSLYSPPPLERCRSNSGASSKPEDKVLSMITGLKAVRDRSVDSTRSVSSSSKKFVAFSQQETLEKSASSPNTNTQSAATTGTSTPLSLPLSAATSPAVAMAESMRSLGNTLNPMNRIAGIGMMRGFGRSPAASPQPQQTHSPIPGKSLVDAGIADLTTAFPDLQPLLPPKEARHGPSKEIKKIAPPNKRFLDVQNPGDLKISEVLELLRDYRRLAGVLKDGGYF